jgi:hypothetical protein
MTVTKTHFAYRIDRWDADGNSIMEHVAGCNDLTVAVAAHDAAVRRWAGEVIALLHSARVIEIAARTGLREMDTLERSPRVVRYLPEDTADDLRCDAGQR